MKQNKTSLIEEKKLFHRLKSGDSTAKDAIIKKYLSYVTNIAKKYAFYFPQIGLAELSAEGNYALLKSIKHYDSKGGASFSSYAWFWIVKYIHEYISKNISLLNIPAQKKAKLKKIILALNNKLRSCSAMQLEKVAKKLDIELEEIKELLLESPKIYETVSLDKYIDEEDKEQTIGDLIPDTVQPSADDIIEKLETQNYVDKILDKLPYLESEVIKLRFGMKDGSRHPYDDISKRLNLSPLTVKNLESTALFKLKQVIDNE